MGSAIDDDLFRNGIRVEEGTEIQQFGSGQIGLLDLLKREGPGSSNGLRIIPVDTTLLFEQISTPCSVECEVIRQGAINFLDICPSLIECERKSVYDTRDFHCLGAIMLMSGPKRTPRSNKACSPKQQQGSDLGVHLPQLDPLSDPSHRLSAGC